MNYKCPNCGHYGEPTKKVKTQNTVVATILILASFFFPLLFFISLPALFAVPFLEKDVQCSQCKWEHIVPVKD